MQSVRILTVSVTFAILLSFPMLAAAQGHSLYVPMLQAPGASDATIILTNSGSSASSVTLIARTYEGIAPQSTRGSAVTVSIPPLNSKVLRVQEVFGQSFAGWIEAQIDSGSIAGSFFLRDTNGSGMESSEMIASPSGRLLFPKVAMDRASENTLVLVNTRSSKLNRVSISLYEDGGRLVAQRTISISGNAGWAGLLADLLPGGGIFKGYAVVSADANSLIGFETYRTATDLASLAALPVSSRLDTGHVAHFASQAGYSSTLVLVNDGGNSQSVSVTVGALQYSAMPSAAPSQTEVLTVAPNQRVELLLSDLFEFSGDEIITGFVRYQLHDDTAGLFGYLELKGRDGRVTVIPAEEFGFENSFLPFLTDRAGDSRMLVLMNPGSLPATVTIETFDARGYPLGTTPVSLEPSGHWSTQLGDSQTADQLGGSVRITATSVVLAIQLTVSTVGGGGLAALPAQGSVDESYRGPTRLSARFGGSVLSVDRGATLEVPPGAINQDLSIEVKPLHVDDFPEPSAGERLIGVVQGTPAGTHFKSPVQLTFPLTDSLQPGTMLPVSIFNPVTHRYDNSGFVATVGESGRSASADVTHFTVFAVSVNQAVQISKLNPQSGPVGSPVDINGSGFSLELDQNKVVFTAKGGGVVVAPVVDATANVARTFVPVGAVSGKVYVLVGTERSNGLRFKVTVVSNLAPSVNAGPDQTLTLSDVTGTTLSGTANDDGLPAGSELNYSWSSISGPAAVAFGNAMSLSTPASFSVAGTYTLRLTASDTALSSRDDIQITVKTPTPSNQAPTVNAGADKTVQLPAAATLNGSAFDDGLPGAALTATWTKISGPGSVTFGNPNSASTTAAFTISGTYTLRLTATDTALASSDDVLVNVGSPAPVNTAPSVNAGPDQTITLPAAANLTGSTVDDGLPGTNLSSSWTRISGPGPVTFGNSSALTTTATFSVPGTYTVGLTVSDGVLSSADNLVILVMAAVVQTAPNTPPKIFGVQVFPANNVWNTPVDSLPAQRAIDVIKDHGGHNFHPDFGTVYNGLFIGIPVNVIAGNSTPKVRVNITTYASESDPLPDGDQRSGFLPVPVNAAFEGDPKTSPSWSTAGDHHLVIIDSDNHTLHELWHAFWQADGSITAEGYSRWDLNSNALRPDYWTSADAAGLPIASGLVVYEQVQACLAVDPLGNSCTLGHALRFTLDLTHGPHIWPARHDADSGSVSNPPFGLRVRLKSTVSTASYSPTNRIILNTLKKYGALLADNGGDWFFQGVPDSRWNDEDLHFLSDLVPTDSFEVVDTSAWIVDPHSAEANINGGGYVAQSWPRSNAILALDFDDPTNVNTAPGFTSFTLAAYNSTRGYGWANTNGMGYRTRPISYDPLWRDIHVTESPSARRFLVDIPNGTYSVSLFFGDPDYQPANAGITVSAEGGPQFTLTGTVTGEKLVKTFPVTVADGQLTLDFSAATAGVLGLEMAGLEIDPATSSPPDSPPPPSPAPTLALSALPTSITSGQMSSLSWSSSNTTSCSASSGWAGALPASGTQAVSPAATTTYSLTCSGAGGSASQSVTVVVTPIVTGTPGTLSLASVGSGLDQKVTIDSVGQFRLVFEAADNWGLSQWYDLLNDPAAQTNLIGPATGVTDEISTAEPGLFQQVFYGTSPDDPKLYTRASSYFFPTSARLFQIIENTPSRITVQAASRPVAGSVGVLANVTGTVKYTIFPNGKIYVHSETTAQNAQTMSTWFNAIVGLQNPGGTGTITPDSRGWVRASSSQNPYSWTGLTEKYLFAYWSPGTPAPYTNWTKASILLVPATNNPLQGRQIIHSWTSFLRWGYGVQNVNIGAGQTISQDYLIQLGTRGSTILPDITNAAVADPIANSYLASPLP